MEQLPTTVINLENGIYALEQQMVRAFLIIGTKKALLLDTLIFDIDIQNYIKEITNLPVEVVLTHGDGDHVANLHHFTEAYIHENDIPLITSRENLCDFKLHTIKEGDEIELGDRKLKIFYTPGHTKGSICLLDITNKILFAGDTISYGPIYMFGPKRNMENYIKSLFRLKEMRDQKIYTTVFCCHNECPMSPDTLEELIQLAEDIEHGTIKGETAELPFPQAESVKIGKNNKYSILFQ